MKSHGRSRSGHKNKQNGKGTKAGLISAGRRQATDLIEKWTPLFPSKTTRNLRYSTNILMTSVSGVVNSYVFAANGLFDPDITSTGHQPMGFDQMMLSYNHYCVLSSRIVCTFKNVSGSPATVCVTAQANNTPITVIDQIIEFGANEHTVLESKNVSGSVKVLDVRTTTRRFEGKPIPMNDPNLCGELLTNPTELQYYHVQCWDTAGNSLSVAVDVLIEYRAVFFEPRELTESLSQQLKRLIHSEERKCPKSS